MATKGNSFFKNISRDKYFILLSLPVIIYFIIFHYVPMYGVIIAFENFSMGKGYFGSEWVWFKWFIEFFNSFYFVRLIKNTVVLSFLSMIFAFPVPIFFALLLNEVRLSLYKRTIQTITYFPHFISMVIVVGNKWYILQSPQFYPQ